MKFIPDQEIILSDKNDLLVTRNYVKTLKEIILNSPQDIDDSFTIGLFGEWGSGKSSIIQTVKKDLESDRGISKVKFIIYDAWKYAEDSFRRMFLLKMQEELHFERTKLMNSFYLNESEDVKIKKHFNLGYSVIVLLSAAIALGLILFVNLQIDYKITIPIVFTTISFFMGVFKKAFDEFKVNIQKPHLFAPEQFEDCFKEMISKSIKHTNVITKVFNWVTGDKHATDIDKLIIVIDNIDRCQKELAYELLTNIKNFLGKNKNVIFLIPVDDEALKRHIEKNNEDKDCKESSEFLRKFFNVTLRLKPLKRYDLYSFSKKINDAYQFGFNPNTIDIIGKEYASNPRRIIQFYNNFMAELENYDKEFSKEYETAICKILIIKEEWPDYYKLICNNPHLIYKNELRPIGILDESPTLKIFLNKTKSVTHHLDISIINKIILNDDELSNIPEVIRLSIDNVDFEPIITFIKEEIDNVILVIDYLIESLKSAVENNRNITTLNLFRIIININKEIHLNRNLNIRIQNEIQEYLNEFLVDGCEEKHELVQYSEDLLECRILYLKEFLLDQVIKEYKKDDFNTIKIEQRNIIKEMIKVYSDEKTISKLQSCFYKEYKNNNVSLSSYSININSYQFLITDEITNYIIETIVNLKKDDKSFNELIDLSKLISLSVNNIISFFVRINAIYPNFNNQPKEVLLEIIKSINVVLDNVSVDITKVDVIKTFYVNIFVNRTVNGINIKLIDELANEEVSYDILIPFLYHIYRITANNVSTVTEMAHLFRYHNARVILKKYFLILKNKNGRNLSPLLDIILSDEIYDADALELLKHAFIYKNNDKHILVDDKLSDKLQVLLNIVNSDNDEFNIKNFLINLLSDERVKNKSVEIITNKSKDEILSLPEDLQKLAFDYICSNNRLVTDYLNETELLKAIAINGKEEHLNALTNVIVNKIIYAKLDEALELIDIAHHFTITNKDILITHLKNVSTDIDKKQFLENAIKKIQGNRELSIFVLDIEEPLEGTSEPASELS